MSEHRRKPPQPQGGGRAAARRAQSGSSSGRRAAPRGATGSSAGSYYGPEAEERPYGGRAEARRAAQRSGGAGGSGGSRRRAAPAPEGRRGRTGPKDRFIDYPRAGKYGAARWVPSWRLVTGAFVAFFASLLLVGGIGYAMVEVPDQDKAALAETNVYYWADGSQMASTGGGTTRQNVEIDDIQPTLRDAVIAAENASFEDDRGVDPMGIARALFNMAKGDEVQGGSTITQQFVKNTYLDQSQTLTRKFKELFISIKVGSKMSKDQILAGYLNTAYYGRNAYGVQAASLAYFGKEAKALSPEECVFLAAVLKGPNLYSPDGGSGDNATPEANRKRAELRWSWILKRMVEVGRMTPEERSKIGDFPELEKRKMSDLTGQKGYLVDIAKTYVAKKADISADELDKRGGYKIYTTFDKDRVRELEKAVQKSRKTLLDEKARPKTDTHVQFGGASIDPDTGAIVAVYGGDGFDKNHFTNNANTSGVPVGSTWKPFVLASAMEYGTIHTNGEPLSPQSLYQGNDGTVITDQSGKPLLNDKNQPFKQANEGPTPWGMITLEKAMEQSVNVPFVQLGIDVGLDKTRETAKRLGILESSFDTGNLDTASFSLGTSTPSAIRMADAYAGFASSGKHYEPFSVTKVEDGEGVALPGFAPPKKKKGLDPEVADNVTKVLENVVQNGTAKALADLPFPNAGKTGTTDENKSAWYVGYTSELSTAVAMFRTNPKDKELLSMNGVGGLTSIHGGDIPADVWKEYMSIAMKDKDYKPKPFPEPAPLGTVYNPSPSPEPSPSQSAPEEDEEKDDKPEPSKPAEPSNTCQPLDFECMTAGGNTTDGQTTDGGTFGGTDNGGTTTGTTTDGTTGGETDTGTVSEGTVFGNTNTGGGNGRGGTTG
ncbi:transglycosylase domain-containing protein [Streptomyces fragilis]|uniref:transglycosylase domain-containing protein n=1 Tax=Streptomyces fragilis TaxID=67301 RepID=UPI000D59976E|nr:transglycosylase domain-containing protein [Streptomyces fragilis]